MKPETQFNAHEGEYSIDSQLAGPQTIAEDLKTLQRMFDPLTTHTLGQEGGIGSDNIKDDAILDNLIGNRTIEDSIIDEYTNTNKLGKLLSFMAKSIKSLKGTSNWFDIPADTINNIHNRVNTNQNNITIANTNLDNHKISNDHDIKYYNKELLDNGQLDNRYHTEVELSSGILDSRYYTKSELSTWLRGGDTYVKEEVFTIVNSNLGDGTFSYSNNGVTVIGNLTLDGGQIFTLGQGIYNPNSNMLEVIINDTLRRSVVSGGIEEVDETSFALTSPEGNGAEITVKYYVRLGMAAEYSIKLSETKPPSNNGKTMWFEVM